MGGGGGSAGYLGGSRGGDIQESMGFGNHGRIRQGGRRLWQPPMDPGGYLKWQGFVSEVFKKLMVLMCRQRTS